uniref:hypothetical protein n=1 Tax=Promicromonospora sp. CA-289581 TaxID=3240013 RepID=UPI003F49B237
MHLLQLGQAQGSTTAAGDHRGGLEVPDGVDELHQADVAGYPFGGLRHTRSGDVCVSGGRYRLEWPITPA